MSCEESYLAIRRYLTDEREPYAPGTHGNTKRKIRKAAVCYVVRNGVLYYQRRQKGQQEFTELEVVLQEGRRKELIDEAHISSGGDHVTQHQTWERISQKYWWRGILKQVKDYIKECSQCQSRQDRGRGSSEDGIQGFGGRGGRRRAAADSDEDGDEEEEMEELDLGLSNQTKSRNIRGADKHELVFVDSNGVVKQFLPKHGQSMLDKLNQQRNSNEFCDITLLIEGETYRAHKAVLAACSDYFHDLFIEKGAAASHEAVVDLSGFTKASILPLLEFAYTSNLTFNFCVMAEVATLARHLLMSEVLEICELVHRKVEAQKLTVYQRGDVHTVVSSEPLEQAEAEPEAEQPGTYVVTMQSDGQAVITPTVGDQAGQPLAVLAHPELAEAGESLALLAEAGQVQAGESLTLLAPDGDGSSAETMTVITHSGQAGSGESLAVVQACWKVDEPQAEASESMETGPIIISVGTAKEVCPEMAILASTAPPSEGSTPPAAAQEPPSTPAPAPAPPPPAPEPAAEAPPPKRRPGRPRKPKPPPEPLPEPVEEAVPEPSPEEAQREEQESGCDDPNRRRLRQRSMGKGGYVRLHMGLEHDEEEEADDNDKKLAGAPRPSPLKALGRTARRGPRKKSDSEEAAVAAATVAAANAEAGPDSQGVGLIEDPEALLQKDKPGDEEALEKPDGATEAGSASETAVDGDYICSECGMVFQRRYALIMHTLKHEKTRGFKCALCHKEFQYAASLRAHMARHKQKKTQRASGAVHSATEGDEGSSGDLETRAKARTKREFVCDICGKTLPKIYSLRIHMLNHTGVRPHTCRVCGKSFAHKHSLKMHQTLHDTVKQFTCTICSKAFVSKRSLEEHTSIHTGESKYLCTTCGRSFFRASGLSKHLKRHLPRPESRCFPCTHCDKSFYEAKDLQQHMNKHLGLKPFQCQVCGKCYSWKKDWYSHVKSHTVAEPYKCNVCGKEFYEKALFRRHVKKATHGKKGRVKQNLERECEHCGRKFTQLREYRRHLNNHEGVKPFECLTCGVAWADARSLKRHVRTHTGERPYVCPVCQEAHIDARTLRKHMSKLHSDYLPGKIMLEKDTLQFHNQGTQVEHAVSILAPELPPELQPPEDAGGTGPNATGTEEIETVLITEETVEAMEAMQAVTEGGVAQGASMATLSDRSIMQVVNYVLAQQAGTKMDEASPDVIQTMEVEVAHVAEVE